MRIVGGSRAPTFPLTTVTDLVEVGVDCPVVSIAELRLLVEDVGQVLVAVSLQGVLGQRPRQPHGLAQHRRPVSQLAGQVRQRVEDGRRVL